MKTTDVCAASKGCRKPRRSGILPRLGANGSDIFQRPIAAGCRSYDAFVRCVRGWNTQRARWPLLPALVALLVMNNSYAHITNEASQGSAVEASASGSDIMLLVAADILPEKPGFKPDQPLSRLDLASWAAFAARLNQGDATLAANALAALALEHGLVDSLAGDAVCQDINVSFFAGRLVLTEPQAVPTQGEAANFIASKLASSPGGALLKERGLQFGPTGEVSRVEQRQNPDGGTTHIITVGKTSMAMYAHGRVGNGPTDLSRWQGRVVRRSLLRELGEHTVWLYLEGESWNQDESDDDEGHAQH